jgi:hypothetical protein
MRRSRAERKPWEPPLADPRAPPISAASIPNHQRVEREAWPEPDSADELHDALL